MIGGLRDELGTREAINYCVRCYNEARHSSADGADLRRRRLQDQIAEIDRQIEQGI